MITLPEEILLLAQDERGRIPRGRRADVLHALAGAAIAELILRRRVSEALGRVRVVDPTPTGEPALDAVLEALRDPAPSNEADAWIRALPRSFTDELRDLAGKRLVERGIVERVERRTAGFLSVDYPMRDRRVHRALAGRIRAVVGGEGSDRELAFARIVDASLLLSRVYESPDDRLAAHNALVRRAPEQPMAEAVAHVVSRGAA